MPREKLYFSLVLSFFIFYFLFNFINTAWSSSETLSDYDSGKVREKMREVEKDDDRGMVNEFEGVQNLGERDVELHEGSGFCLCGGGGVDGSGGSGVVDGSEWE